MPSTAEPTHPVFFDAGIFIGALLSGDPRHGEARPLVESARRGELSACPTAGVLSEVYGALTWEGAQPNHGPVEAAEAVRLLVEMPSAIRVLDEGLEVALLALRLAAAHGLRARRVHDARHAAPAPGAGALGRGAHLLRVRRSPAGPPDERAGVVAENRPAGQSYIQHTRNRRSA